MDERNYFLANNLDYLSDNLETYFKFFNQMKATFASALLLTVFVAAQDSETIGDVTHPANTLVGKYTRQSNECKA